MKLTFEWASRYAGGASLTTFTDKVKKRIYMKMVLRIIILFSLLSGCASTVKYEFKLPSLQENDPHAVIKEENLKENFVTTNQ